MVPWSLAISRAKNHKAGALLASKNADSMIAALTEVETYYIVKELGLEDAGPILALLKTEQIRALLDLDVWRNHGMDISDLLTWFQGFAEAGRVAAAAKSLDLEALSLLFRRRLLIATRPKEDRSDPEPVPEWLQNPPEGLALIETPDGRFIIAPRSIDERDELEDMTHRRVDEEEQKGILELIDKLYKDEDWNYVARALDLARTDLSFELEEEAYRFRCGRIEDYGFAPLERAVQVYAPLSPDAVPSAETWTPTTELFLPALHAETLARGLFHEAMTMIKDADQVRRIEGDLVPLANLVLVADGVEPGATHAVRDSLTRMKGYIEIALGHRATPLLETAARRLVDTPLKALFRLGYTLTLQLKTRALKLEADPAFSFLPDTERAMIEPLLLKRPKFFEAETARAFSSIEEVERTTAMLEEVEGLFEAVAVLGLLREESEEVLPENPAEHTLDRLVATLGAQLILGGQKRPTPLTAQDLADLADRLAGAHQRKGGEVRFSKDLEDEVVRRACEGLRAPLGLEKQLRLQLQRLAEVLWPLVGVSEIDPRFVDVVLRRPG